MRYTTRTFVQEKEIYAFVYDCEMPQVISSPERERGLLVTMLSESESLSESLGF
jgi:hypothetical protein